MTVVALKAAISIRVAALVAANAARWKVMHVDSDLRSTINKFCDLMLAAKPRYQTVSEATHVPWYVIAVIHCREASLSWAGCLANGDPWDRETIHEPRGVGPWMSWENAAEYALLYCSPRAAEWADWSIGGLLTLLESYNGYGYAGMGLPSPYIWASTDQYRHGKYVADGHYDPAAIDHQLGCASMLSMMALMDHTITLV